jgi:hypothetical protein
MTDGKAGPRTASAVNLPVVWEYTCLPFAVQERSAWDNWVTVGRFEHKALAIADATDRAKRGAKTRVVET